MSQKVLPPKKPINAYFRFQEEVIENVKKTNPEKSHKEIIGIVGQMY